MAKRKYPVILEKGNLNYGIYTADFHGCISTGKTPKETLDNMRDALQGHIDWMKQDGDPIPTPTPINEVQFDAATETLYEMEVEV